MRHDIFIAHLVVFTGHVFCVPPLMCRNVSLRGVSVSRTHSPAASLTGCPTARSLVIVGVIREGCPTLRDIYNIKISTIYHQYKINQYKISRGCTWAVQLGNNTTDFVFYEKKLTGNWNCTVSVACGKLWPSVEISYFEGLDT